MKEKNLESKISMEEKWCATINYSLIGLLWYLFDNEMRHKPFVKYHAKQSITILFVVMIIELLMGLMPFLLGVWIIFILITFLLSLIGILQALEGKKKPIPFIGKYASKIRI